MENDRDILDIVCTNRFSSINVVNPKDRICVNKALDMQGFKYSVQRMTTFVPFQNQVCFFLSNLSYPFPVRRAPGQTPAGRASSPSCAGTFEHICCVLCDGLYWHLPPSIPHLNRQLSFGCTQSQDHIQKRRKRTENRREERHGVRLVSPYCKDNLIISLNQSFIQTSIKMETGILVKICSTLKINKICFPSGDTNV